MSSEMDRIFDDLIFVINDKLNLNDTSNFQYYYNYEKNGWYYYLYKSVKKDNKIKIIIKRSNYKQGHIKYYNDKPIGKRIMEEAEIYKNINLRNSSENDFTMYKYTFQLF